jgi:uncharacterized protein (TIGR04255 family)
MAKLPNAPLQEVIFEVRWALQLSEEKKQWGDLEFELASGRLSTILEHELPVYRRIVGSNIPEQFLFYRVVHQYWKAEQVWPVIQLGPGIFTINCTDEWYDWEINFFPFIKRGIQWLTQAYRKPLQFEFASLRYVDGINIKDFGGLGSGWQEFIGKHFNFSFNNLFNTKGNQKQIQINQVFELEDQSALQIQISDGLKKNELALIWQTTILKKQSYTSEQLVEWADKSHMILHNLFEEMLKPETYACFNRKN